MYVEALKYEVVVSHKNGFPLSKITESINIIEIERQSFLEGYSI